MSEINIWRRDRTSVHEVSAAKNFIQEANELCEKALNDAKAELHPLLRTADVNRLENRNEFMQGFRAALEKRIARKIASWQPTVQSVFRFDYSHAAHDPSWDGKIHLLAEVPQLSNTLKALGRSLDKYLLRHFNQLGWSRFQRQPSILEIQQVTLNELRHGIGYGAMFCAVHSVPVRVWPQKS